MHQYKGGIAFVSFYYKCKKETIADSENFFVFINELNTNFTVSKAIVDLSENEWSLVFAAWYPGSYEKKRFSIFIDSWNHDTSILFRRDSEKIKRYLK